MSEQWPGTLAAQAATWVPPWARRPVDQRQPSVDPAEAEATDAEEPEAAAEAVTEVAPPTVAQAEPPAVAQAEPPAVAQAVSTAVAQAAPVEAEPAVDVASVRDVASVTEVAPEADPLSDVDLNAALEAILLVVDEPVGEIVLAQVLEQPRARVAGALNQLATGYTKGGRGFELRRVARGWRLYTRPEYSRYVERFVLDGQHSRLTQAALETLAVVAYKQPVTRSRISAIRGVNCDGVVRTLVARGLIEAYGSEPDSGAFLYRTTTLFLEKLGVDGVEQLPPLAPFLPDDLEEIADAQR
jgi:segregation and condensation protein B